MRADVDVRACLPVSMDPEMVAGLASNRVRAMLLPRAVFGQRRVGSLLWVREPMVIDPRQPQRDKLWLRYSGASRSVAVDWPPALPKPSGRKGPLGMPVECSRYTLLVESFDVIRLSHIETDDMISCGLEAREGGWAPWHAGEAFMPYAGRTEALRASFASGYRLDGAETNQKVALVRFRAICRPIVKVASGLAGVA